MKYAFINGIILDGTENMEPVEGKMILVNGSIIEDIVDQGPCNGYEVIDLKGKYIMPGLINMHVHLAGNGKPLKKARDNTKLVKLIFSNLLLFGKNMIFGVDAGVNRDAEIHIFGVCRQGYITYFANRYTV